MSLTIITIWLGCVLIGVSGALASLAQRWPRAMLIIIVAGIYSIAILKKLQGGLPGILQQQGEIAIWLTMLATLSMWLLLATGTSIAVWKQRSCSPLGRS